MFKGNRLAKKIRFNHIYQKVSDEGAARSGTATTRQSDLTLSGRDFVYDRIRSFPTTRYYGSKRRLIPWIYENLKKLSFSTVLDGFGGTASVSLLFKAMGKRVTFNDALLSNTVAARALLSDRDAIGGPEELDRFLAAIEPRKGFIARTFKGIYYTDQENAWLDGLMSAIHSQISVEKKDAYLYCVFQACLKKRPFNLFHRANLYMRLNQTCGRSFGNQTTWNAGFSELIRKAYRELTQTIWDSGNKHQVLNPTDVTELAGNYDLVYFDPPYVGKSNNSDNYLKRYHFLDGLAQYPIWSSFIDRNSKIRCLHQIPHIKEWQRKCKFKMRLFDLISMHRKSTVALSYVAGGYPSKEEIARHFRKSFADVKIVCMDLQHALATGKREETLFIGVQS